MTVQIGDWYYVGDLRVKIKRPPAKKSRFGLSPRELTVCCYLTQGARVSEIAKAMNVSVNTVNTFKSRLFRKLNVSSAAEAAVIVTAVLCGGTIESAITGEGYDTLSRADLSEIDAEPEDMQVAV